MTVIVPREEDKPVPVHRGMMLAIAVACALLATNSAGFAYDGPSFRGGLWKLETDGKANDRLQTSGLPIDRQIIRCVNPTLELKAELTPLKVGGCSAKDLRKTDDGYVFQKVCGALRRSRPRSMLKGTAPTRKPVRAPLERFRRKKRWWRSGLAIAVPRAERNHRQ